MYRYALILVMKYRENFAFSYFKDRIADTSNGAKCNDKVALIAD